MNDTRITNEIKNCLSEYNVDYTESGVNDLFHTWKNQKSGLIDILRKHPQWNEDQMAVSFDFDSERTIDRKSYNKSIFEIVNIWSNSLSGKEVTIRDFDDMKLQYGESLGGDARGYSFTFFKGMKNLCGKTVTLRAFDCRDGEIYTFENLSASSMDIGMTSLCNQYEILKFLEWFNPTTFVDEDFKIRCTQLGFKCNIGQKVSRVINKIFTDIGIANDKNYNRIFAVLSDSINPMKITRHTCLSVHPCDFLNMSNGDGWRSCHSLDGGCYQAGTLSYLCDPVSMIFYTVSSEYTGSEMWSQPKINRQVYCYGKELLLQSRLYPTYSDVENSKNFRNVVQSIFAMALGINNLWMLKQDIIEIGNYVRTVNDSLHYADYTYSEYLPSLSIYKERTATGGITVGYLASCLNCGKTLTESESVVCDHCCEVKCECCGCYRGEDEMLMIGDSYYCDDCAAICNDCGQVFLRSNDGHWIYNQYGSSHMVCNDCLDNYVLCDECGDYFTESYMHKYGEGSIRKGKHICKRCLKYAKYSGALKTCSCGNVYLRNETIECSVCKELEAKCEENHSERTAI